jgi:hypothetical protein
MSTLNPITATAQPTVVVGHKVINGKGYTFSRHAPVGFNEAVEAALMAGSDFITAIAAGTRAFEAKANAAFEASRAAATPNQSEQFSLNPPTE